MPLHRGPTTEPGRCHLVEKRAHMRVIRAPAAEFLRILFFFFLSLRATSEHRRRRHQPRRRTSRQEAGHSGLSDRPVGRRADAHGEQQTVRATFCPLSCCVCVAESLFVSVWIQLSKVWPLDAGVMVCRMVVWEPKAGLMFFKVRVS